MVKAVAYIATAILLGIATMLPVIVLTPKWAGTYPKTGYYALEEDARLLFKGDVERLQKEEFEIATGPIGPFHLGSILAFGFVLALGVSLYFKRRMF